MGNHGKISRKQSSKVYAEFFIFPFRVSFSRRNFYCKRRNPFSVFVRVSESIEVGISLLVRVTEMLFLWLERLRLEQNS